MKANATINLSVPAATKGRWVRASRAADMRLTDFIVDAVEAYMQQQLTKVVIPDDVSFSDLHLARDPDGGISLDWAPIERICEASGLSIDLFRSGPEDNLAALVTRWYTAHRQNGGAADAVADDLFTEALIEGAAGQHVSHTPGRA